MSSKKELIIYGYTREKGKQFSLNVPEAIIVVILMFYKAKYTIFAIGKDEDHQFGKKKVSNNKFHHSEEISKLCQHPNRSYMGNYIHLVAMIVYNADMVQTIIIILVIINKEESI